MKNFTWSWDEEEDVRVSEPDYPEDLYQAEQGMQALEEAMCRKYQSEEQCIPARPNTEIGQDKVND